MRKTARIVMRMDAALKRAVMRAAADEQQSMSSYVGELLHKHLKATGYMAAREKNGGREAQSAAHARDMAHSAIDKALQHSTATRRIQSDRRRALTEFPSGVRQDGRHASRKTK